MKTISAHQPLPSLFAVTPSGSEHIEALRMKIQADASVVRVTLLDNALLRGKECMQFGIGLKKEWRPADVRQAILERLPEATLKSLHEMLTKTALEFPLAPGSSENYGDACLSIFRQSVPAIRVYSPLLKARLPRMTARPGRWQASHAVRLLANGQFADLKCLGQYSDDYRRDSERNYGRDESINVDVLTQRLVERPSAWDVGEATDGSLMMSWACCEHYQLTPVL